MSVKTDQVNLIINVNGNAAQNQLNELRKRAADLTFEMKNNLKKGTEEYIAAASELKKVNADMAAIKQTIGITALSQKELTAELKKLTSLRNNVTPLSKEWKDYNDQIQKVIARQNEIKSNTKGLAKVTSSAYSEISSGLKGLVASYIGFQAVIAGIKSLITNSIKLSDQLGDLRRVAGLTADEATNLNHALLQIDTRTSGAGLLSIAIIAGKLGVAKDDILAFTQATDKLVVTLGDELGSADEITTQLGKILNVFDGTITGENITHLGNAIVDLANKGVATGPYIVDFTQRVAGIAKASNISLGATVGLAAGFEALGLRSESSSTALQKLLLTISQNVPKAAKIAGVPLTEFNKLFAEKPQEALIKYAEGLVKNKKAFSEITSSFKNAGEEGARVVSTLLAIGQRGEYLREQIDLGNKSIKEQTALDEGFAIKNDNLAGSINKLSKEFDKLVANNKVQSFLKGIVDEVTGLTKAVDKMISVGFAETFSRVGEGLKTLIKDGPIGLAVLNAERKAAEDALNAFHEEQQKQGEIVPLGTPGALTLVLPKDTTPGKKPATNTLSGDTTDSSDKAKAEYERLKKEAADFYKSLQKLKEDAANASKSQDEKELIALEEKYKELHAKAQEYFKKNITDRKTYTAEEKLLVETFNKELADLQKKQFGTRSADEYSQALKASDDYFASIKRNTEREYAEGKISKEDYENSLTKIEGLAIQNRIQIAKDYSTTVKKAEDDVKNYTIQQEDFITQNLQKQKELRISFLQEEANAARDIRNIQINDPSTSPGKRADLQKQNAKEDRDAAIAELKASLKAQGQAYDDSAVAMTEKGVEIFAKYNDAIAAADEELKLRRIQNQQFFADEALSITSNLLTALDNLDQRELQKDQIKNNAKKAGYKKQLDEKLISQKQYDKKVAEADAEMDKKKQELDLKAFKRKQALAISEALIDGALAIEKTYVEMGGFPTALPFVIAMGIATLAQVAAIASQAPPSMGDGGLISNGPYHKDKGKGLPLINPLTGKPELYLEKDEAVIKGDAVRDKKKYTVTGTPSQIASKLNSMHGGVSWAPGAVINMPAFRKPAPQMNSDIPLIMEQGGLIRPLNKNQDPQAIADQTAGLLKDVIGKLDELKTEMQSLDRELHAVVSIKEYRAKEKQYDAAKKAGGISQ